MSEREPHDEAGVRRGTPVHMKNPMRGGPVQSRNSHTVEERYGGGGTPITAHIRAGGVWAGDGER